MIKFQTTTLVFIWIFVSLKGRPENEQGKQANYLINVRLVSVVVGEVVNTCEHKYQKL